MGRWIRGGGVGVFASTLAIVLMGADFCGLAPPSCETELEQGHTYEVTLIDDYVIDGPFVIDRVPDLDGLPSCARSDGLGVGATFRFRVTRGPTPFPCGVGVTVISGINGVDLSRPLARSTSSAFDVVTANYSLIANRDRTPYVNVRPTHGRRPPLQVVRTMTTCGDVFAAQIFDVSNTDAGVSPDAR